jgi:hypothetical protein
VEVTLAVVVTVLDGTIYDERANSGHARSHGTISFDCKMSGKRALDRCVHLELREA